MNNNEHDLMYQFKGSLMKELSKKLKKSVDITIFYKEDGNFVGVVLSVPNDNKEDTINSRLYRIYDPWDKISRNASPSMIVTPIIDQYKSYILSRYFKEN